MAIDVILGLLGLAGFVMVLAGWVGCIDAINKQDEDWSLWSFIFDAVLLFGILRYWSVAKSPFLVLLAGAGALALGILFDAVFPAATP